MSLRYKRLYKLFEQFVIRKKHGCWKWSGKVDYQGYAVIAGVKAARISWEKRYGLIPFGKCILHKCDNPECTKYRHLWPGTKGENNTDRAIKGRNKFKWKILTIEQVIDIRFLYSTGLYNQADLAREFKVSGCTIWQIITGRSYKYV